MKKESGLPVSRKQKQLRESIKLLNWTKYQTGYPWNALAWHIWLQGAVDQSLELKVQELHNYITGEIW